MVNDQKMRLSDILGLWQWWRSRSLRLCQEMSAKAAMSCEISFSCVWRKCILSSSWAEKSYFLIVNFLFIWCTVCIAHSFLYDQRMKETMAFRFHQENSDQFFNGTLMIKTVSFVALPIIDISTNKQRELLIPIAVWQNCSFCTCSGLHCCSGSAN